MSSTTGVLEVGRKRVGGKSLVMIRLEEFTAALDPGTAKRIGESIIRAAEDAEALQTALDEARKFAVSRYSEGKDELRD